MYIVNQEKILKELIENKIVDKSAYVASTYKGATKSIILKVKDTQKKIAVKVEKPNITEKATVFLQTYKEINLFPNLIYIAKDKTFFAYGFLENELFHAKNLYSKTVLKIVDKVINKYEVSNKDFWGHFAWPKKTIFVP